MTQAIMKKITGKGFALTYDESLYRVETRALLDDLLIALQLHSEQKSKS